MFRLEKWSTAIASRLEAIDLRLEAVASRLEAIACGLKSSLGMGAVKVEGYGGRFFSSTREWEFLSNPANK